MRILMAGKSHELLRLCRDCGHEVVAVASPDVLVREWQGLPVYADDRAAAGEAGADGFLIAIDEPERRRAVFASFEAMGLTAVDAIGGRLGLGARHGRGAVVQQLANLSEDTVAGIGLRLNIGANVMHDCRLGDFVTVAPGAVVLGRVTIGDDTYIGANATVLPDLCVGARCLVGAGAVVTRDVPDGATVKGVPAR